MKSQKPNTGAVALVALCNEYCRALDTAQEAEPADFYRTLLRLLPRIYITAFDLLPDGVSGEGESTGAIYGTMEEEEYHALRDRLAAVFGEHDTYLDTFSEDMKYSDTPIAASLSEQLADLYQVFFDFIDTVREWPDDDRSEVYAEMKYRFNLYWSENLCNALRVLNSLYQKEAYSEE